MALSGYWIKKKNRLLRVLLSLLHPHPVPFASYYSLAKC